MHTTIRLTIATTLFLIASAAAADNATQTSRAITAAAIASQGNAAIADIRLRSFERLRRDIRPLELAPPTEQTPHRDTELARANTDR